MLQLCVAFGHLTSGQLHVSGFTIHQLLLCSFDSENKVSEFTRKNPSKHVLKKSGKCKKKIGQLISNMDFFFGDFCVTLNNENFKYPYQFNVNKSRSEQICNYLDCLLMMMIMIQGMIQIMFCAIWNEIASTSALTRRLSLTFVHCVCSRPL